MKQRGTTHKGSISLATTTLIDRLYSYIKLKITLKFEGKI